MASDSATEASLATESKGGSAPSRSLLAPRPALHPVEYPEFLEFKDAIRHSYWVHTEYNLNDDVQDLRVKVQPHEREAIRKTLLAIAQVEVAVKTFWGDLRLWFPKPEVSAVGFTFAESEVRHQDAYAHLLELTGLTEAFANLHSEPAFGARLAFLNRRLAVKPSGRPDADGRTAALSTLLFSAFVEHVSLFGLFLIMKSFDRKRGLFKGIANVVEATSKEEQLHAQFGYLVVRLLREEHPEWFEGRFADEVRGACLEAHASEMAILDWIFSQGEFEFMDSRTVKAYVEARFDGAMTSAGFEPLFAPDPALVAETAWFEEEVLAGRHYDFFHKRPTTYARKTRPISPDELFG